MRRLEPENTSPLGPNRGAASASIGQGRPASEWLRYAAFGRLDLLDFARVALISGFSVLSFFVVGFLVTWYSRD